MSEALRHPARHYIYYLLSRRSAKVKEIIEHLSEVQVPLPQDKQALVKLIQTLIAIQRNMRIPPGFDPLAKVMNPQTTAFLGKWKITSMWRRDPFVAKASDLLFEAHIRRSIEVMLLGPLSAQNIARKVCTRWSMPESALNPRVIREYGHYYWNYGSMNQAQWKDFLHSHYPRFTENTDYALALSVPRTTEGAMLALSLSDRGADGMSDTQMYSMMRNQTAVMFMQHALLERPSIQRAQSVLSMITSFKMATEELDKHRGASAELLDELRTMEPVYDRSIVATIHDIPIERPVPVLVEDNKKSEVPT